MSQIAVIFNDAFSRWGINLPSGALEQRRRGEIQAAGWRIQYLFGADEHGEYLDYYATHRMTNDRHVRIYASGAVENLEAPLEFMIFPANSTDEEQERIHQEHIAANRRIYAALKDKGFGDL